MSNQLNRAVADSYAFELAYMSEEDASATVRELRLARTRLDRILAVVSADEARRIISDCIGSGHIGRAATEVCYDELNHLLNRP
jgi:hypothetical protein